MKPAKVALALMSILFLLLACKPATPVGENEKSSACAHEEIMLLEPGWEVVWSARIDDGYIEGRPYVIGDNLILIDQNISDLGQGRLRAHRLDTGEEVWRSAFSESFPDRATLQITDTTYIAEYSDRSSAVSVLYADTGREAIRIDTSWIFDLAMDNERLYVHDYFGHFRAYSLSTGAIVWERQLPEAMRGSALFATRGRLVVSLMTGLWVLDAESGQTIAQFPPNSSASTQLYEDSFLVGEEGVGLAFLQATSVETGELLWHERYQPSITYEPPAYLDGVLYFPANSGNFVGAKEIVAADLETGDSLWKYQLDEGTGILSGIVIMNDTGYAIFSDRTLRAIDLEDGRTSVVLRSDSLYDLTTHWNEDRDEGGYRPPGIAIVNDYMFASFGCQTVYALRLSQQ